MLTTMESLVALLLVLLGGGLWLDALRARECALAHARRACDRAAVQLLDQAIALRGLSLHWTLVGLRLRRSYAFEFSSEGVERRSGRVVLLGLRLEALEMELDADGGPADQESGRFVP